MGVVDRAEVDDDKVFRFSRHTKTPVVGKGQMRGRGGGGGEDEDIDRDPPGRKEHSRDQHSTYINKHAGVTSLCVAK